VEYNLKHVTLDGYVCLGPLFSYELMEDVATDHFSESEKEYLINDVLSHYKKYSKITTAYSSMRALRTFADTGDYASISKNYMKSFPVKWRIYLFNKMIEILRCNQKSDSLSLDGYTNDFEFNIIDDSKLLLPDNTGMDCTPSSFLSSSILYDTKSDGSLLSYNYTVEICNKSLSGFYNIFIDYLKDAGFLCSEETTLLLLEECILRARRSEHTNNNC
jgi:hypothetical protein